MEVSGFVLCLRFPVRIRVSRSLVTQRRNCIGLRRIISLT